MWMAYNQIWHNYFGRDLKTQHFGIKNLQTTMTTNTKSKINIRPLDDRIVVENTAAEDKSAGGILLPETAKEKPQNGKVIATGPGRLSKDGARLPLGVKKGDKVVYGKYAGTDIKIEGTEYKILRESEILAKFE